MENHRLVRPEHLNQFGFLFGGHLLKWVDEYAWIAASLDYPECSFVTMALDQVVFKVGAQEGTILKFIIEKIKEGTTSVQYSVKVYRGRKYSKEENEFFFGTNTTFVNIDENGNKKPIRETIEKKCPTRKSKS